MTLVDIAEEQEATTEQQEKPKKKRKGPQPTPKGEKFPRYTKAFQYLDSEESGKRMERAAKKMGMRRSEFIRLCVRERVERMGMGV